MFLNNVAHKDDANGVPHFMGLTGRALSIAVSVVATNGFLLFGIYGILGKSDQG
jgi:hypothetical protein